MSYASITSFPDHREYPSETALAQRRGFQIRLRSVCPLGRFENLQQAYINQVRQFGYEAVHWAGSRTGPVDSRTINSVGSRSD